MNLLLPRRKEGGPPGSRPAMPRALAAAASLLCLHLAAAAQGASPSPASPGNPAPGDPRIASLLQTLSSVRTPTAAAISPDGNTVAWTVAAEGVSELHLTPVAPAAMPQPPARERILSPDTIANSANQKAGACAASQPAWSPSGAQLAFLSDCTGGTGGWQPTSQDNIFLWTREANTIKQLSHLHGEVSSLRWSPDGKAIAFLYVENATRRAGALDAMKPWSGVIGEDGVEVQRLFSLDLATGISRSLTPGNLHVYEFSWAPGSDRIAFVGADPPGENNWWVARIYSLSLVPPGAQPEVILNPTTVPGPLHGLQIAVPRFSPDGGQIAFIGGLMSDQGVTGGDIYLIPASGIPPGGEPKDLTPNRPASPAWITWLDGHTLGISEHAGGSSHLTALDPTTGQALPSIDLTLPETIMAGADQMSVSTSNTSNIALIRQSFDHPPEVWAGPLSNLRQITHLNDAVKPAWGHAESIDYTNQGFPIQGWLLYPAGWTPADAANGKQYPLVVGVHGGPSGAVTPHWPGATYSEVPFSALGYFVFVPNPRGSFGQGEKFTQANVKDFGYGDLRDILAGVDAIEQRFPIDKAREGITGWSYGGFMTMFAVTQTTRFKAAVAGAGISNWQSYYGENSIDQWMVPFFGATVYDDPAVYAKSSAINFIKNAKTPTLVVVGDRDGECPAPQSFEFWHALRAQGVKTQLVVYPDEGHHFTDPEHQVDVLRRALRWFETEMPPQQLQQ